jgi:hypothetical protein
LSGSGERGTSKQEKDDEAENGEGEKKSSGKCEQKREF